ncbi:ArnT family glycosyltransferase [Polyangium aurulentum]|uniref:ArnT family glycosyltransferase n=1 Tax=Polyangium aurulentum TaxID=2567896 RepID=UPI0010ADCB38|nr:glycosyltransferase family 39 protein [Polyangium aurulentum]UQA58946.1 glycosyltransferase family 39 protein [Polyangium aurulentum]
MSFRSRFLLPRGFDGLPVASEREARIARVVTVVATAWFALAAAWEMFGPLLAGHYASSASMGIIAENMLRWGIVGPVWEYTTTKPTPDMYYCHHPWGIFWVTTAFMKIFGRHDFVCRLPAIVLSAATPPLLAALGRALFRPAAGAAAAAAFAVLPITLAFANFNALEVPLIAWTLLALWGWVRLEQTWRRRYLGVSLLGLLMALHADWPAFVLAGEVLFFALVRGYLGGRRFFGPIDERRHAEAWIAWSTVSVLSGVLYLAVFHRSGKLVDLLSVYGSRSAGSAMPLAAVLESRRYWIELSFTPIAILLGKIAAVVSLVRLFALRRSVEVVPLAYLGMAVFQYVVFKQGADVHVFWPQAFGAYFGLAMGALVATLAPVLELLAERVRRARGLATQRPWAHGGTLALAIALVPILFILRDGVPALRYARETGGRFNEKGLLIDSDGDKTAFLRWLAAGLSPRATVEMHEGMKATWAQVWALGGRVVKVNRPPPAGPLAGADDVYVMDSRFASEEHLAAVAGRFHVVAVGPFWAVRPREPFAPIEAYSFAESEPSPLAWMLVSGTEPTRAVVPDPYLAWELRTHWDQPAEAPSAPPRTLEDRRIAHNIAVARGDSAAAAAMEAEIARELSPIGAALEGGAELLGKRFEEGARPLLTLFVRAGGPMPAGATLAVRSRVVARPFLSTTMADPTTREVGLPLAIPPGRLRAGFLYADPVPIRKRPGTEVFQALFTGGRGRGAPRGASAGGIEVLRVD